MASVAAAPATENPLSFMETLGSLVAAYRPSEASGRGGSGHQPRLIIFAAWTDARDLHIAKYIVTYQALYPAAQILLLKGTTTQIIKPHTTGPAMRHAVPVVRAAFPAPASSTSSPELLVHIFSNGGSGSIANLYEQFAAAAGPEEDTHLPPHVTIMDSCPSRWSIDHGVTFATTGYSSIQKLLAAPILYPVAIVWSVLIALGFIPDSLGDWGRAHNDNPGNKNEMRRVYIYSATDMLIDPRGVEDHAADATAKGFSVALEKYEDSAHVAHMRKDEARYWGIVRRLWEGTS